MADYFARHCTADYQRKALSDALNISMGAVSAGELSLSIAKWLGEEEKHEAKGIGGFLNGPPEIKVNSRITGKLPEMEQKDKSFKLPQEEISVFYGLEGKRLATEYFLLEVLAQSNPQNLLLYSDEATDWMTADSKFAARWAQLMIGVLAKGTRIKIVHTVSRDLDEMLNAILQWMPLYMTGLIEPYYYPKKRDGLFKQTRFISPGVSAVIAGSIGNSIDYSVNWLIRNNDAIRAYTEEFNQYLNQCKPLMRIFTAKDKELYLETLIEFEKERSNSIIKTESLSLLTMPETISPAIMSRMGMKNGNLIGYQKERIKIFEKNLQTNSIVEIVPKFDLETVKKGKVKVSLSDMMIDDSVYYTQEEYIQHLTHLVHLLKTYETFHIKFIEEAPASNYMVYAKEDLGAIIAKTSPPPVVLAVNETNLTAAFWDFLRHMIGEKDYQSPNNTEEIRMLEEYIHAIKEKYPKNYER
ncbi:MAG TPA: transcriptional regulator [Clostridia bacterium]|nr:transcriptional regulator [Clostridia bacterium]